MKCIQFCITRNALQWICVALMLTCQTMKAEEMTESIIRPSSTNRVGYTFDIVFAESGVEDVQCVFVSIEPKDRNVLPRSANFESWQGGELLLACEIKEARKAAIPARIRNKRPDATGFYVIRLKQDLIDGARLSVAVSKVNVCLLNVIDWWRLHKGVREPR